MDRTILSKEVHVRLIMNRNRSNPDTGGAIATATWLATVGCIARMRREC